MPRSPYFLTPSYLKYLFLGLFAWLSITPDALRAQAEDVAPADTIPAFSALRPPTSPAFTLLGVEPTSVERPSTPSGFAIAVASAFDNSTLPQDFAIEFAPFWLASHPRLTWRDDVKRNPVQSFARTFTFSAATAEIGTEDAPVTGLSIGGRASLLSGTMSNQTVAALGRLEKSLAREGSIFLEFQDNDPQFEALNQELVDAARQGNTDKIDSIKVALDALNNALRDGRAFKDAIEKERAKFDDLDIVREGWFLDVAGGVVLAAPGGIWDSVDVNRWGAWSTLSYQKGSWSPVFVARYLGSTDEADMVDLGFRLIYNVGDFGLSAEGVYRTFVNGDDTPDDQYRLVGAVEYRVQKDAWLIASFGRDHNTESGGSLVAQLGLSLNLNRSRFQLPD